MRHFVVAFAVCGVAVATALAGFSFAGVQSPKSAGAVTNVTVHMNEYSFTLSAGAARLGTVVFTIVNDGSAPHNFSIGGKTSDTIAGGALTKLSVNFATPGARDYVCTLPGHADAGMKGTFTVTGTPPTVTTRLNAALTNFGIRLTTSSGAKVRSVKHGVIRFKIKNVKGSHNFAIKSKAASRVLSKRGQRTTLTVVLKRGRYAYLCQVNGHAALGMKGVLVVT
jgi:plastocyanin